MSRNTLYLKWKQEFKRECPQDFEAAVAYAGDPAIEMEIYKSDETGEKLWAISPANTDMWMCAFPTKKAAVSFCKKIGWRLK